MLSTVNKNRDVCRVTKYSMAVATTVFGGASLSIVTAIGSDRLLALLLRLRYRQVVTIKRVRTAVFLFWFRSSGVKFLYFQSVHLFFIVSSVLILSEVVISSYSYTRIFFTIRRQGTTVEDVLQRGNTGAFMTRYKKIVF